MRSAVRFRHAPTFFSFFLAASVAPPCRFVATRARDITKHVSCLHPPNRTLVLSKTRFPDAFCLKKATTRPAQRHTLPRASRITRSRTTSALSVYYSLVGSGSASRRWQQYVPVSAARARTRALLLFSDPPRENVFSPAFADSTGSPPTSLPLARRVLRARSLLN